MFPSHLSHMWSLQSCIKPPPCSIYARNAARCFVWRLGLPWLWASQHPAQCGNASEEGGLAIWLLPPVPDHLSCLLVLDPVTVTAVFSQVSLFFLAPSEQCFFLASFLLVSLGGSLRCFLPRQGGELCVTICITQ